MRISDWSSDVCSSDLTVATVPRRLIAEAIDMIVFIAGRGLARRIETIARVAGVDPDGGYRSEERRVGKECVGTCRSRWWPYQSKKKQNPTKTQPTNEDYCEDD